MGARRTALRNILDTFREELVDYKVYDKDGVFKRTDEINVLQVVPTDLRPLNQDLTVEYLRPLKRIIQEVSLNDKNIVNKNPMFNYGSQGVLVSGLLSNGEVVEASSSIPNLSGTHVFRNPDSSVQDSSFSFQTINPLRIFQNDSTTANVRSDRPFKTGFSYYIDNSTTGDIAYYFHVIVLIVDPAGGNNYLWDWEENKFDQNANNSNSNTLMIKNTVKGKWQNWSNTFPPLDIDGEEFNEIKVVIFGTGYEDSTQESNHNFVYFDNFFVAMEEESQKIITKREQNSNNTVTGLEIKRDLKLSNELADTVSDHGIIGEFERLINPNTYDTLEAHITQEIINDYRSFVKRYEGTLYGFSPNAISLMNKLWINFGTDLTEDYTAYIDSMKYNIKKNEYQVIAHLSNQDNDQSSDYSVSFE